MGEQREISQETVALGAWVAIGIGVGTALGAATGSMAAGLPLGLVLGIVIGLVQRRRLKNQTGKDEESPLQDGDSPAEG